MNPEQLEILLQATTPEGLAELMASYQLTIDTLQALKEEMEKIRVSDPSRALQLANLAYQLGLQMLGPAASLGRWTLANAFLYTGRYHEAAAFYQQARIDYLAGGYELDAARMGVGQVGVMAYIGESEQALALAKQIEPLLLSASKTNLGDLRRLGILFMNVGVVYDVLGRYEDALAIYDQLTHIATQLNDQLMLAQMTHNRGYALVQIGALSEAMAAYTQAETLFQALNANVELVRLYMNLAKLFSLLGSYDVATQTYAKADHLLALMADADQQRHDLTLLRVLGELDHNISIGDATLAALRAAQKAFADHRNAVGEGLTWLVLGWCYLKKAQWENAQQAFAQAQHLARLNADRALEYRVLHGLGHLAEAQQQIEPAITLYAMAIQQIEAVRQELRIEVFRADFLANRLVIYQDLTQVYLRLGRLEEAFLIIERAKSRLLTEKLTFRLGVEATELAKDAPAEIHELTDQLNVVLQKLENQYRQAQLASLQADSNLADPVGPETRTAIAKLEQQVQSLTRAIQRSQPFFSPFATVEPVPLHHLQNCLGKEILLYYYVLHTEIRAFVINQTGILAEVRLGPLAAIETTQQALATAIERILEISVRFEPTRAKRYLPSLLADANKQLQTLYQALIQPLAQYLAAAPALLIAPDGPLHALPFPALFDGEHYLVEQHTVSLTPSASVLNFCRRPSLFQTPRILLMGYTDERLHSVTTEMEQLAQILPTADVVVDQAATTTHFLTNAPAYSILHFATHAQFRLDDPLLSSLALADRRLTLAEIARLQLNADLVVLNGCETGRGQLRGGDLLSLASGFLGAGAHSLLVSLWRVEDQVAAELMAHFYQALLAGQSRAQALRTAQLALLNQGRQSTEQNSLYAHPAFWAPFTLLGNSLELTKLQAA